MTISQDEYMAKQKQTGTGGEVTFVKNTKVRTRGRPQKIHMMPASNEAAQLQKEKQKHYQNDDFLQKVREDPDSMDVIDEAVQELVKEASSLEFERMQAERRNEDTADLSYKRMRAIKEAMGIVFDKREMVVDETFDFTSERFHKFISFVFSKVRTAAKNTGLEEETIQILIDKTATLFEEGKWEDEARKKINENLE